MSEPEGSRERSDETSEAAFGEPEPWARWETVLCLGSAATGLVALCLLGLAVNIWLL